MIPIHVNYRAITWMYGSLRKNNADRLEHDGRNEKEDMKDFLPRIVLRKINQMEDVRICAVRTVWKTQEIEIAGWDWCVKEKKKLWLYFS